MKEDVNMNTEERLLAFARVVKWMHVNDGVFSDKNNWRSGLIYFLARELKIESLIYDDPEFFEETEAIE